jgi:hypothetical protein
LDSFLALLSPRSDLLQATVTVTVIIDLSANMTLAPSRQRIIGLKNTLFRLRSSIDVAVVAIKRDHAMLANIEHHGQTIALSSRMTIHGRYRHKN